MSTTTPKPQSGSRGDKSRQNNRPLRSAERQGCPETSPDRNAVVERPAVAKPVDKPEEKPTVGPIVQVQAPKVVLVKRPYMKDLNLKPHRLGVQLKTSIPFDGTGTLSCDQAAKIRICDAQEGGSLKDLPLDIPGAELSGGKTVYVEGVAPSDKKEDVKLTLALKDDAGKYKVVGPKTDELTVLKAWLEVCGPRPDGGGDPPVLSGKLKDPPVRELYRQGSQFLSPRAQVRIRKEPHDAPCKLILKPTADKVRIFPETGTDTKGNTQSLETHMTEEKAAVLPRQIGPTEITDAKKGMIFWAEGAKLTAGGPKERFHLDVDEVDTEVDTVAFTVVLAKLEIEVTRKDDSPLSKNVKIDLKEKADKPKVYATGETARKDAGKPHKKTFDVDPGDYLIALTPQNEEKDFRITRTEPKDKDDKASTESAVKVPARPLTEAKYVLEPDYEKIQFIGYHVRTGQYIGTDEPASFANIAAGQEKDALEKARKAVQDDIDGRCEIMTEAIKEAYKHAKVMNDDPEVLKIFMAPEFYFRGQQGAYPIETVSTIMPTMRAETDDDKYKDWLFVFGTALGYREISAKGPVFTGNVTAKPWSAYVSFHCPKASRATKVENDWKLQVANAGGAWAPLLPEMSFTIDNVDHFATSSTDEYYEVRLTSVPSFDSKRKLAVRRPVKRGKRHEVSLYKKEKQVWTYVELRGSPKVAKGWYYEQGSTRGVVVEADHKGGDSYELLLSLRTNEDIDEVTPIKFHDPGETEIFNVALVRKGGSGTPVQADGRTSLKEVLVYKEHISFVDFEGMDYGADEFDDEERHLIEIHGDKQRRAIPTEGSTAVLGKKPNEPGKYSEVNKTGIGGGSVFTIDDITFGLEVCLDHAQERLKGYYGGGKAAKGEPMVQVQLIPSCGMSIQDRCCAVTGLVFNVDGNPEHPTDGLPVKGKKYSPDGDIPTTGSMPKVKNPDGKYFPKGKDGTIIVYEPQKKPDAKKVDGP